MACVAVKAPCTLLPRADGSLGVVELPFAARAEEPQVRWPARNGSLTAPIRRRSCAKKQEQNNDYGSAERNKETGREGHLDGPGQDGFVSRSLRRAGTA